MYVPYLEISVVVLVTCRLNTFEISASLGFRVAILAFYDILFLNNFLLKVASIT